MEKHDCARCFALRWDDLTNDEKELATEQYICIREHEEGRERHKTTNDYPEPINPAGVKQCKFERHDDGPGIWVLI